MTTLKTDKIKTSLCKKGFQENKHKDHIYFYYFVDGKKSAVYTKISHGVNEIDDALVGLMARQTKLKKSDFIKLIECTLSKEEYYDKVKNKV